MTPTSLELHNIGSFRGVHRLDLANVDMAVLVGPNGAGKSTLVDAIGWSLFGEWRGSAADDVITHGEREGGATLHFTLGEHSFRVERTRRRGGKGALLFEVHQDGIWRSLTGGSIRETETRICERIGMDGSLWRRTSMVAQEESSLFSRATPGERKQVLFDVLEMGQWLVLLTRAKERQAATGGEITVAQTQLDQVRQQLEGRAEAEGDAGEIRDSLGVRQQARDQTAARVEQLGRDLLAIAGEVERARALEARLEELGREQETARIEAANIEARIAAVVQWLQGSDTQSVRQSAGRIEDLESEVQVADDLHRRLADAKHQLEMRQSAADSESRACQSKADAAQTALDQARRQGQLLGQVPCKDTALQPQCELLAAARKAHDAVEGLERDLQASQADFETVDKHGRAAIAEAQRSTEGVQLSLSDCRPVNTLKQELVAAREAREKVAEIKARTERLAEMRERQGPLAEKVTDLQRRAHEARTELDGLGPVGERRSRLDFDLNNAKRDLHIEETAIATLTRELGGAQERLDALARAEGDLPGIEERLEVAQRTARVLTFLMDAFGRNGIPALLLDQALPDLETQVNEVLALLSDGRMSVRLDTQRQKVTGGLAETLDIIISQDGGERDYATYSGGERMRIDLALRIGLSRLLANRAGARCETLILDETAAPLDEQGRRQLVDCLGRIYAARLFRLILVVTHLEELRDAFPHRIEVTRNGGGSQIALAAG